MRKLKLLFSVAFTTLIFNAALAQLQSLPPSGANQKSLVRQYMGAVTYVEIIYNSPDVAGREGKIWGQLVPYGKANLGFGWSTADNPSPWRAGANESTTIEFSHDMQVQGKDIKAGTYGLFVEPQETGDWEIIFSRESNGWGAYFYVPEDEVLRVSATPEDSEFHEYLTYEFTNRKNDQTTVNLMWENKNLPFTISVPNANDITLAALDSELKNNTGFMHTNLATAASWASGAGYHDKAIEWAEAAVSAPFVGVKDFTSLSTKGAVLMAAGKMDEAVDVMDEAIKDPAATSFQIHGYGRQLIGAGMADKALEIFKYNHERFEGAWPTNYGLARGYSAVGDFKNALKYMKLAKKYVPEGDNLNGPMIDSNIEKLEKGEDIN